MTTDELTQQFRATLAALEPIGFPGAGVSLHKPTPGAVAAALAMPGAKFYRYDRAIHQGYIRMTIDGVELALHDVSVDAAKAAGFVVAWNGRGVRARR